MSSLTSYPSTLHAFITWPASTFRRHPRDHLIRVHDVARFAVHAVRRVNLQARTVCLRNDLIHVGRTESNARMPVFLAADGMTDLGVHQEVRRLIFLVARPGEMDVGQFVERQLAIGFELRHGMGMPWILKLSHLQMSWHAGNSGTDPPALRQHLQPRERETAEQPVLERLMHMLHWPHFGADPALPDFLVVLHQPRFRRVARDDSIERGLRREHTGFHREMNALEPERIEKPG